MPNHLWCAGNSSRYKFAAGPIGSDQIGSDQIDSDQIGRELSFNESNLP